MATGVQIPSGFSTKESNMIRIFPSFSFLITCHIKEWGSFKRSKYIHIDNENTLYFFGCTKQGVDETWRSYDQNQVVIRENLMAILDFAESQDRVFWRIPGDDSQARKWLSEKLNIDLSPVSWINNLPEMRDFFANHTNIKYMFDLGD